MKTYHTSIKENAPLYSLWETGNLRVPMFATSYKACQEKGTLQVNPLDV